MLSIAHAAPVSIENIAYIVKFIEREAPTFFLVAARIFGLGMQAPFFSAKSMPAQVRATLIVALATMYVIVMRPVVPDVPQNNFMYSIALIQEIMIGAMFGFCVSIISSAIQAAGEIIDVQMGMSMVMLFNPQTKSQSSAMGKLFFQIELTVFILAQGHLYLLSAFFDTFQTVPIGSFNFGSGIVMAEFIHTVSKIFYVSLKLALPVLVVLFIIDFSLGITNKVSPQINVLELNFAMKPTTGMMILLILMTTYVSVIKEYTYEKIRDGVSLTKVMAKSTKEDRIKKEKEKDPFLRRYQNR
jgi:flagellar biosynthetic protein FliR